VTKEEDDRDWTKGELKSLDATAKLIERNGGVVLNSLEDVADFLNKEHEKWMKAEKERVENYYKKRTEHLLRLFNKLVNEILPNGWYCNAMDTWQCEEEEVEECIARLHRRGVQRRIKSK
jgi:predicted RNA-binding protein Jag